MKQMLQNLQPTATIPTIHIHFRDLQGQDHVSTLFIQVRQKLCAQCRVDGSVIIWLQRGHRRLTLIFWSDFAIAFVTLAAGRNGFL